MSAPCSRKLRTGRVNAGSLSQKNVLTYSLTSTDEKHVVETLAILPYNQFFDVDIYAITPPDLADATLRTQS